MLAIGLTGGIGSGKSTVARMFAELGTPVINADDVARDLTNTATKTTELIARSLGRNWLDESGALNRDFARQQIYTSPELKEKLEAILHPLIFQRLAQWTSRQTGCYAILEIPLLFEKPLFSAVVDRTLLVDCPEDIQIQRVMARNQLTKSEVLGIMQNQMPRQQRHLLCDDCILNSSSYATLAEQVKTLHARYLSIGKVRNGFSND